MTVRFLSSLSSTVSSALLLMMQHLGRVHTQQEKAISWKSQIKPSVAPTDYLLQLLSC